MSSVSIRERRSSDPADPLLGERRRQALRILVADHQPIFRRRIMSFLEHRGLRVVAEASNGYEAIRLVRDVSPDVAILDLALPLLNGPDTAEEIARASPWTGTILLTPHTDEPYLTRALQSGIRGYVLKSRVPEDLMQAIREVFRGAFYLSPGLSRAGIRASVIRDDGFDGPLTVREREVLQLVAEGKRTKEIGTLLGVSAKTVDTHRTHIMKKLDIHSTAGLVRYAVRHGLVPV